MATTTPVTERIAESVGGLPTTELRRVRALADAGLIPKGAAGGGGKKADFDDQALGFMALAQSGALPSDAPATVQRLRDLVDEEFGQTLLDFVTAQIRVAATAWGRESLIQEIEEGTRRGVPSRELVLAPDAQIAWESGHVEGASYRHLRRFMRPAGVAPQYTPSTVRRLTTISLGLFVVLGDLYADALAKRSTASDPEPGLALGEGAPTPENDDAGNPCDGAPASCQPNVSPTDGFLGRQENAPKHTKFQAQGARSAGCSPAPSHGARHERSHLPLCAGSAD